MARRRIRHECCGALLGRDAGEVAGNNPAKYPVASEREILALYPLVNRRDDSPRNRFSVTSEDVMAAEKAARASDMDVVGWYHSHPDHPARPSPVPIAIMRGRGTATSS